MGILLVDMLIHPLEHSQFIKTDDLREYYYFFKYNVRPVIIPPNNNDIIG